MLSKWKTILTALAILCATVACSISALPFTSTPTANPVPPASATSASAPTAAAAPTAAPGATQPPQLPLPTAAGPANTSGSASGLIAYLGSDGNIYTTDSAGNQNTALTKDALLTPSGGQTGRVYQFPTWSPDGQRVAFMRFSSDGITSTQSTLMTQKADGTQQVEAFTSQDTAPFYLYWSPDSQRVSFLTDDVTGGLALYIASAAGGSVKVIGAGSPYYWDWSPDNRTLIVHTGGDAGTNPQARLALVQVDGPVVQNNLDLMPGQFQAPDWSPSGDSMALITQDATGSQSLVLAGRDGKLVQTLAKLDGEVAFGWSPRGGYLAYTLLTNSSGNAASTLVLLDTAHPDQPKVIGAAELLEFFWSPDGSKIAYFVPAGSGQQSSVQMVAQTAPQLNLDVYIYDLASGKSKQVANFAPTDTFEQVLPFYDQYQRSGTIWSPDSRSLVLAGVQANGADTIFVVDAAGGPMRKIAQGEVAFWSWK